MKRYLHQIILFCLLGITCLEAVLCPRLLDSFFPRGYSYPLQPGTPEWQELAQEDFSKVIEACQIPEGLLARMSTEDLIYSVLRYPFNMNLASGNTPRAGYFWVSLNSNAYPELEARKDAPEMLVKVFTQFQVPDDQDIDRRKELHYLERIVLEDFYWNQFSEEQKKQITGSAAAKRQDKLKKGYPPVQAEHFFDAAADLGQSLPEE